jgi:glycosyltransferase involved in cell wall biosynthesis
VNDNNPNAMNISVIIPVYNMEAFVLKTLDSVRLQTRIPNELIIVNDGSTDSSLTIIEYWIKTHQKTINIKLINKQNGGLSSARNSGVRKATGELIALLDSDDRYEPEFLERAFDAFQEIPNLALFFANQKVVNLNDEKLFDWLETKEIMHASFVNVSKSINRIEGSIVPNLVNGNFISCSASVFSAKFLDKNFLYDESLTAGEDVEFLIRYLSDKNVAFTFEELAIVLRHSGSITQSKRHLVHMGRIFALDKHKTKLESYDVDVANIIYQQFEHCYYQLSLVSYRALSDFAIQASKSISLYHPPSLKHKLRAFLRFFKG